MYVKLLARLRHFCPKNIHRANSPPILSNCYLTKTPM